MGKDVKIVFYLKTRLMNVVFNDGKLWEAHMNPCNITLSNVEFESVSLYIVFNYSSMHFLYLKQIQSKDHLIHML